MEACARIWVAARLRRLLWYKGDVISISNFLVKNIVLKISLPGQCYQFLLNMAQLVFISTAKQDYEKKFLYFLLIVT